MIAYTQGRESACNKLGNLKVFQLLDVRLCTLGQICLCKFQRLQISDTK